MAENTEPNKALPEAEKKKEQSLPFYQLFSFADKYDWVLMISGSIGAIIHGSSMPVFFLLFGEMVNGFGKNQSDLKKMTDEVSKVKKKWKVKKNPFHSDFKVSIFHIKAFILDLGSDFSFLFFIVIIAVCSVFCIPWSRCLLFILCRYAFLFFLGNFLAYFLI